MSADQKRIKGVMDAWTAKNTSSTPSSNTKTSTGSPKKTTTNIKTTTTSSKTTQTSNTSSKPTPSKTEAPKTTTTTTPKPATTPPPVRKESSGFFSSMTSKIKGMMVGTSSPTEKAPDMVISGPVAVVHSGHVGLGTGDGIEMKGSNVPQEIKLMMEKVEAALKADGGRKLSKKEKQMLIADLLSDDLDKLAAKSTSSTPKPTVPVTTTPKVEVKPTVKPTTATKPPPTLTKPTNMQTTPTTGHTSMSPVIAAKDKEIAELKKNINTLEERVKLLDSSNRDANDKLTKTNQEKADLLADKRKLESSCEQLKITQTNNRATMAIDMNKNIEEKIQTLQSQLLKQVEAAKASATAAEKERDMLALNKKTLESEVSELKGRVATLTNAQATGTSAETTLKKRVEDLEGDNSTLKNKLQNAEGDKLSAQKQLQQSETQAQNLASAKKALEAELQKLETGKSKEITDLETKLAKEAKDKSEAVGKSKDLELEIAALKAASNSSTTQITNELNKFKTQLQGEIDGLRKELGTVEATKTKLESDNAHLQTEAKAAKSKYESAQTFSQGLETQIAEKSARVKELEATTAKQQESIQHLNDETQKLNKDLKAMQHTQSQGETGVLKTQISGLENRLATTEGALSARDVKIIEMESKLKNSDVLVAKLEKQNTEIDTELLKLKLELDAKSLLQKESNQKDANFDAQITKLEGIIEGYQSDFAKLQKENAALEKQVTDLEAKANTSNYDKKEIASLKSQLADKDAAINALQSELEAKSNMPEPVFAPIPGPPPPGPPPPPINTNTSAPPRDTTADRPSRGGLLGEIHSHDATRLKHVSVQISKASNPDSITSYLLERIKQRRGEMQDEDDSDDDGEFD